MFITIVCVDCFADSFRAEAETKAKLEKVSEIKKMNAQMMAIKSEISKYEDTLKEYQLYKEFLENLTPPVGISCKTKYFFGGNFYSLYLKLVDFLIQ